MQLELNFNQKDLQTNVVELVDNMYRIFICMQILSKAV
jgi:hypothetical protein